MKFLLDECVEGRLLPYNEIDDYIAAFSAEERQEYVAAETALDLACLLYYIRQEQGLTQRAEAL